MKHICLHLALITALPLGLATVGIAPAAAAESAAPAAGSVTEGEVRRIDRDAQKITLRHGPIQNPKMPGMTMAFAVRDAAMLDKVKVGDKVNFSVEKSGNAYFVTNIEAIK